VVSAAEKLQPVRVQLSRKRGWRMPENTVKVARPGPWGNPFIVNPKVRAGAKAGAIYFALPTLEEAIACYREMVECDEWADMRERAASELRGKHLACWCPIGSPCHADILLEIANR
jgi:uncharacterized protein DUF4326